MFDKLLARLAKHLQRGEILFMVIGGQAVLRYGEPRLTKDIDVTLGVGIEQLEHIQHLLRGMRLDSLVKLPAAFVNRKV